MANGTPLGLDQITELLGSTRQRGVYVEELKNFIGSGEAGVQIDLTSGTFAGKKAASVKASFETAKKNENAPAGASDVQVIAREDNVFLINRAVVNGTSGDTDEE